MGVNPNIIKAIPIFRRMEKSRHDRIILHIDMNSFYAAVEIQDNPSLRGVPVVVGADPKKGEGRGVVSTCSYEARAHGVHAGMPISKAYRLLSGKDAIFLPVTMPRYKKVSEDVMAILRRYADKFQQVSIDEAFLDLTDRVDTWDGAEKIAKQIKHDIFDRTGLTCSVGSAPSKSVAKIASALNKPDGLTIVKPDDVIAFLSSLPVSRISGIGRKTEARLNVLGIYTIGQLSDADIKLIESEFGEIGLKMRLLAMGIDETEVKDRGEPKSIGFEDTFDVDTDDSVFIHDTIDQISQKIHDRLFRERYRFRTVTVKVRFEDFETHTRSKTIHSHSNKKEAIEKLSKELLSAFIGRGKRIRLIGVRVSNLKSADPEQMRLDDFLC
jgi:DNA polymerase IV (DinB-like DNA polymerase)